MNKSNASQSNSDLSDSQEKPQNHKYPQFEEELYPKEKPDDKVSPIETSPKDKQNITNKNKEAPPPHPKDADVEVMDLSFRSQSNMSMDQSRKDWLLKESVDVAGMKSLDEKMKQENIGMTTSVQVTHQDILNKRDNTLKEKVHSDPQKGVQKDTNEMEESHYDFLNGHIKTNRTAKNPTEVEAESPNTKLVTQQSKHEIGELIDTVKKDRIFTEPDSVHENFADDNTLYHIHALMTSSRNISVQTHKKEDRKPDFLFGNVIVKILEANQVRDGMLRAYMVYKIQTKVVGNSEKEYIVTRRYRDFDALFEHLSAKYQGHVIPILPPKSIKTTLQLGDEEFYKTRKRELGVFLNNCLKHPFVKETDELEFFLTDQNGFHSSITKKDQGYFAWLNSDLWSNLFNLVSYAAKGDNGQTVYREKTNIDNELDNYENMFEILGKRLQAISQYLTQFLESRDKGIKATASFALELETIKMKKEELQDSKRQTTSLYSKGADVEKGLVASMLEKTKADLKDIMNIVEAVNVALKRRNAHIRELHKFQEIVEIKSLKAKKNLSSSQKLDELKSECKLWKEDLQKLSSTLLKEISQYQSEISESLNTFCQGIFQGNKQGLEKACELWSIKPEPSQ